MGEIFDFGRNVSRETSDRFEGYVSILRKWNPAINLVARSTIDDVRRRHLADSVQIFDLAPPVARTWTDLGSGGGFPGLVAAILAADERPDLRVTLVESDQRKAAFLDTVSRELGLTTEVRAERIEALEPLKAEVVSARALAPLATLVRFADRHLATGGVALFPKGANHQVEIDQALEDWKFSYQKTPSRTDPDAVILTIGGITRV
ncbi:16S rRNA (guanine(527)-N(7))-methyltransferase RsmG [Defluviimonas sp. WL0024]|uniref:Ribosomal RNA small subunit methyltransferase G n=1 Tax=Albidovulum salinarum TaxID=2984153 RepID=A0ABT2X2C2_9RHOB|nr:16S rRNA (guanine(527)-N(7))-methyltransferase RsmG [Defluviimonas sp. WL0024]MCU9848102.1 16S rRNA (guanine(527)-N(7))-methyltransferase RsmG [Defluviimonas sp. WL0024]